MNQAPAGRPRTALHRLRARVRRLPRWWPVPLCALLGAAGGAAYQAVEPPRYAATGHRTAARTRAHLPALARASAPDAPVPPSAPLSIAVGGSAGGLLGGLVLLVLLVRPRDRRPALRAGGAVPAPAHTAIEAGAVPAAEDAVR